ncbi:MAG: hypothetical protein IPN69_24600 [Acidobacteria bacterium]|nr:hypothetical protein [Acidobacteriota bacterium]MBK8147573.1 hypothetical protein [Acidobacteriota bacterium]MBK8813891.1 hypothetical protein [Acidobacteriota bacterium]
MKNQTIILVVVCVFVALAAGCSFTTAKIAKLDFGKNDKASPSTTSFEMSDKIFAVTEVSGAMGKHKMKFKISYEDVAGKKKGEEALSKEIEFDGSAAPYLSFNVPAGGTYKVDATLLDETGKEIETKSGTVTVKGAPASTPDTSASKTDADKDADSDEKKDDK